MPAKGYSKPPRYADPSPCPVMSITQAARAFHVSPNTLEYHIARGNVEAWLIPDSRVYVISVASLQALYPHYSPHLPQQMETPF